MKINYRGPRNLVERVNDIFADITQEDYTRKDIPSVVVGLPSDILCEKCVPFSSEKVNAIVESVFNRLSILELRYMLEVSRAHKKSKNLSMVKTKQFTKEYYKLINELNELRFTLYGSELNGAVAFYYPKSDELYFDPMVIVVYACNFGITKHRSLIPTKPNLVGYAGHEMVHFDFGNLDYVREIRGIYQKGLRGEELYLKVNEIFGSTDQLGFLPAEEAVACLYFGGKVKYSGYFNRESYNKYSSEREKWVNFYSSLEVMANEQGKVAVLKEVKECVALSVTDKTPLLNIFKKRNPTFIF